MNILHLKYALEVANSGSVSKASQNLFMNQPNLSRAIKELEGEIGISIFDRTAKGMVVTVEGEEFLSRARLIIDQFNEVEEIYSKGKIKKLRFSVSVPRASYFSHAFTEFTKSIHSIAPAEFYYRETNAMRAINNLLHADYKLAIVRYSAAYEYYFLKMFSKNNLSSEVIAEFNHILVMSKNHPLAKNEAISSEDLKPFTEIAHADPFVPSLSLNEVKKEELNDDIQKKIFVFERASQFDLLSNNSQTFMWISPMPQSALDEYGLVKKEVKDSAKTYKDVLLYKSDYKLTSLDKEFVEQLHAAKNKYFK